MGRVKRQRDRQRHDSAFPSQGAHRRARRACAAYSPHARHGYLHNIACVTRCWRRHGWNLRAYVGKGGGRGREMESRALAGGTAAVPVVRGAARGDTA